VLLVTEKRLDPIIDFVWHFQLQIFVEHSTVSYTVGGLGKVQCVHNDKVVGLKEGGDGVEEMNKSYCGEIIWYVTNNNLPTTTDKVVH